MESIYTPEKAHQRYFLKNGDEVRGASSIAKVDDDNTRLIAWANKLGLDGINWRKKRDAHADAGSVGHFLIQCHFQRLIPNFKKVSQEAIEAGQEVYQKFMDWWTDNDLTWVMSEVELVSEIYGYGGTIDLVAKDHRDRIWVIDVKTGKGLYFSNMTQIAGLGQLWNENHQPPVFKHVLARLPRDPNDSIEEFPVRNAEACFKTFLAQLAYTNAKYEAGGYKL